MEEQGECLLPKIVCNPQRKNNKIAIFTKFVENKYGLELGDYWKLHEWSCQNYPEFWECVWEFFGVISSQPYTEVFDKSRSFSDMEWFTGARLNFAENVFKYRDSHVALVVTDSRDEVESLTYKQLYEEVCLYAASLKNIGVNKGDVVACYMSNKKEAVFAFLATATLGAVWTGALPILGAKIVQSRFFQTSPKILFTAGNFIFGGKEIKMIEKLLHIIPALPTLEKVVFAPSRNPGVLENIQNVPKCCTIDEFLGEARNKYQTDPWDLEFEQLPFDYPLTISFTSGTTGLPKAVVHSTGAFFASLRDFGLHEDITRDDVLINFSPVGWISWNMHVNCLPLGMTLCLYEGYPFEESPARFWDLVDQLGITSAYVWTSSIEDMEMKCYAPQASHSLGSLRQMFLIGSVVKPHTFDMLSDLKPGLFFESCYGSTEVFGMISGLHSNLPVYRGEIQCFSLAMDVQCLDHKGKQVVGERADLVICNPYPAMPVALLHDHHKEKLRENYLSQYPGCWFVGDHGWINPVTKGLILYGRSDETLNPKGARFSSSEIYFALDSFPGLVDCACVSHFNRQRDERVVLFIKMAPGQELDDETRQSIRRTIEHHLSFEHVPQLIIQVPDIPYNMTGKKLTISVKRIVNKMPLLNADLVVNPESLEFLKNIDLGEF